MRRKATVLIVLLGIWVGGFALSAWLLSLLWNWVAAGMFGWLTLSFWQILFALIVVSLLGGFRRGSR